MDTQVLTCTHPPLPSYTQRLGFISGHRKIVFSINPTDSLLGTPYTAVRCLMLHFPLHWIPNLHPSHAHAPLCVMFYPFYYFALNILYSLPLQISVHSPYSLHPIVLANMFFLRLKSPFVTTKILASGHHSVGGQNCWKPQRVSLRKRCVQGNIWWPQALEAFKCDSFAWDTCFYKNCMIIFY